MRLLAAVWLGACSYTPPATGTGDSSTDTPVTGDGPRGDATVDARVDAAPIDASTGCLNLATATSPAGHHYFVTAHLDRNAAQAVCAGVGGHLAKIETSVEDDFLNTRFGLDGQSANGFVWIGLSDPTSTDVYVWTDLTPLLGFNSFNNGTPPSSSSNCVDSGGGSWSAFGCSFSNHGGVCECE